MKTSTYKIVSTILCSLIIINMSHAQVNVDSLQQVLKTKIDEKTKISIYIKLSEVLRQTNVDSAKIYIQKATVLAQEIGDKTLETEANMGKVPIFAYENKVEEAIDITNSSLAYYESIADTSKILTCYNSLGILYKIQRKIELASETYKKGIELAGSDLKRKSRLLMNLAVIQQLMGDFVLATQTTFEALKILKSFNDKPYIGALYNNIGTLYTEQRDVEKAIKYYRLALKTLEETTNEITKINTNINIAKTYNSTDSTLLAFQHFTEALRLSEAIGYEEFVIITKCNIAFYYVKSGETTKAQLLVKELETVRNKMKTKDLRTFHRTKSILFEINNQYNLALKETQKALKISTTNDILSGKVNDFKRLSDLYKKRGDYKAAYNYFVNYKVLNDSLITQDKLAELKVKQAEYEFEQRQIVQEKTFQAKQALAEKTIRLKNITTIGLVAVLILMAGWLFTIFKAKEQGKKYAQELESQVAKRTAELQMSNKDLEQANYELRTFNYIASHDIKEPIRVIGGYAGLVFRKLPADLKESLGEYFDMIKRSTNQLYTLIEDFANYTTMSKNETIEKQNVDLNFLTFSVVEQLEESIKKYNGQILTSDLPSIKTVNSLLFTIFKNLIENGLKYNDSNNPTVNINYKKTKTHHKIIISDNGIGIKTEYQEKVFEMFKRLHNRGEYEGSGIGLAIVKLSLEKLDGTIQLKSEVGKGSKFIIQLPIG